MEIPHTNFAIRRYRFYGIIIILHKYKSARTVGAKGRVFPEALTQLALAGGGGSLFLQVKYMVRL